MIYAPLLLLLIMIICLWCHDSCVSGHPHVQALNTFWTSWWSSLQRGVQFMPWDQPRFLCTCCERIQSSGGTSSGGTALLTLNLSTKSGWVVSFMSWLLYLREKGPLCPTACLEASMKRKCLSHARNLTPSTMTTLDWLKPITRSSLAYTCQVKVCSDNPFSAVIH